MTVDNDTIIVGGGVAAASCAYHLANAGKSDILILEKDQPASKASGRAAGFLTPDQFLATGTHNKAHKYIINFWENVSKQYGLPVHYKDAYTFAREESSLDHINELHKNTTINSRVLDPNEIEQEIPNIQVDDIIGAFAFDDGMYCDPHLATNTLFDAMGEKGIEIRLEEVVDINANGGRKTVKTAGREYTSRKVIIAAGAWSKQVAQLLDISIPLKPRISQIAMLQANLSNEIPLINDPDIGLYYRSEKDGDVLIGGGTGSDELDPNDFQTTATESFIQEVAQKAPQLSVELENSRLSSDWAGRCSATPDRHPIVGETEIEGIYLCCGFNGEGIMYSAPAGRLIKDLITNETTPFNRKPYAPSRFPDDVGEFDIKSAVEW